MDIFGGVVVSVIAVVVIWFLVYLYRGRHTQVAYLESTDRLTASNNRLAEAVNRLADAMAKK
jgi:hypothetical protein